MRCPRCSGVRVVEAFRPGEEPRPVRICLDCTAFWSATEAAVAQGHRAD